MWASILRNKYWAFLVSPFSIFYKLITDFRNYLYDIEYKPSFEFESIVISVGNLAVGGTGKTPCTEMILRYLQHRENSDKYLIASLSRGYGRKSRGFIIADSEASALTIGDEPFQLYQKFNQSVKISVGEERILAIPSLHLEIPDLKYVVLDDAFQHRKVKPAISIVTTTHDNPFYQDYVLPSGSLRESRKGIRRADAIIVTKCPKGISIKEEEGIVLEIRKYTASPVFFSSIQYQDLQSKKGLTPRFKKAVLLSGIANPRTFLQQERENTEIIKEFVFKDHHRYTKYQVNQILSVAKQNDAIIICTEKDYMRLQEFFSEIPELKEILYYRPIEMKLLPNSERFLRWFEDKLMEVEA